MKVKIFLLILLLAGPVLAKGKKVKHPFDLFDHEMHTGLFEAAGIACEVCHADPESFEKKEKINRLGCHTCHNNPNPPLPAEQDCTRCHQIGKSPPPSSHKAGWLSKHEYYAKQNIQGCFQCHTNSMFCIDCHKRRDTVTQRMHRRNFRFFHSIEARANPRKCDACHTVTYCQTCHAGMGDSKR